MDSDNIVEVYVHHIGKSEIHKILKKLKHLTHLGEKIMSSINEFSGKLNESFGKMNESISSIKEDIQQLNQEISKLQESPGKISSEDQASLDKIQEHAQSIASSLEDLDKLNPKKNEGGEAPQASGGSEEKKPEDSDSA